MTYTYTPRDYVAEEEAKEREERETEAKRREDVATKRSEEQAHQQQLERDAQARALRRLRPALEKALREPISGPLRLSRISARSFLHGQVSGQFHQMFTGQSPRWDALQALMVAIAGLPSTSALTGRSLGLPLSNADLAELDAIECAVWRALVVTAQIIAGEVEEKR